MFHLVAADLLGIDPFVFDLPPQPSCLRKIKRIVSVEFDVRHSFIVIVAFSFLVDVLEFHNMDNLPMVGNGCFETDRPRDWSHAGSVLVVSLVRLSVHSPELDGGSFHVTVGNLSSFQTLM